MEILIALVVALFIGFVAYVIASIVPFTKAYAQIIGLLIALFVFLNRIGVL